MRAGAPLAAAPGSAGAAACIGGVGGAVGGANQLAAAVVPKPVGLIVHFHGHMRATVEVSTHLTLKTHSKGQTGLSGIHHIKRDPLSTVDQIATVAQGDMLFIHVA